MNIKRIFGFCVACGGNIKKRFDVEYCALRDKYRDIPLQGYCCEDCGLHYDKLPNKKAREELRKKNESILRMSLKIKKRFIKKMDKIQANLNHNKRMK